MVQEQQKLKERMEEIYKFYKEGEQFGEKEIEQEKDKLAEVIAYKIKKSIDKINCDIERYVAWKLENGVIIYDITHDYDPPYDQSGNLVAINRELNRYSTKRFHDFLEQYVGYSVASYISGMGILYPNFKREIQEKLEIVLQKIRYETIEEMFYMRKIDLIILDKIDIETEKIETEEELYELFYEILEEMIWRGIDYWNENILYKLPIYIENERLRKIYKKHEFEMRRLAKNLKNYNEEYADFIEKLREKAMEIVIDSKFKRKIELNDKQLIQELEMTYSKEQLGLLSYFYILQFSNKLKLKYENMIEKEILEKRKELKKKYPYEVKYEWE